MKRIICWLIGHDWVEHPLTRDLNAAAAFCRCERCGHKGWLL